MWIRRRAEVRSPTAWIVAGLAGAVGLVAVYLGILIAAHDYNPDFLRIDTCLDSGGRWDYDQQVCDPASGTRPPPGRPRGEGALVLPADAQIAAARDLLAASRALTSAEVTAIQAAVRSALAGKYAVRRDVVPGVDDYGREDEYLLDERARVVFHRFPTREPALPESVAYTILEFTDLPAVRCADRSRVAGRRLGFSYAQGRKGWQLANAMIVDDDGSPWATDSPGYGFLHAAAETVTDLRLRKVQGRLARGFAIPGVPVTETHWIDANTLLPIEEVQQATLEGKSVETSSRWSYPPPRPIGRPPGVTLPDCI